MDIQYPLKTNIPELNRWKERVDRNKYYPNYQATDQGAIGINGKITIKDLINRIGTTMASIICRHNGISNYTTYIVTTNITIPSHIILVREYGAIFDGTGILTINSPFEYRPSECFGPSITVNYGDVLYSYTKTMAGNETFVYTGGSHRQCFLDPGGANRNFDPSGNFPSGFKTEIINTGEEIITFDSTASAQNIGPGQIGTFICNGSVWY